VIEANKLAVNIPEVIEFKRRVNRIETFLARWLHRLEVRSDLDERDREVMAVLMELFPEHGLLHRD
jgi:hypothetical protein